MREQIRRVGFQVALFLALAGFSVPGVQAQSIVLPPGFEVTLVAQGLASPTTMQFAPDGRLFVAEQHGRLRVIENGSLLPNPFVTLAVNASGERGLLGIAFDPDFATNSYIYLYYTTATDPIHNRISRFIANANEVVPGSEVVLFDLNDLTSADNHNGGAMNFGPDGKLYVAVGENARPTEAQSLNNLLGKMLRLNPTGSIPADNPFVGSTVGKNRAIWALGLRNPFSFSFQPGTGRMFINDVGYQTWEEINDGIAGSNYGWPITEGPTSNPAFRGPLYAYPHSGSGVTGCAITGSAFYNPTTVRFPLNYLGDYFFADYCNRWIRRYDIATDTVKDFASSTHPYVVSVKISDDGHLYYLARGSSSSDGRVYRIRYVGTNTPPTITQHPADWTAARDETATFTCRADGTPPISYRWQRNGVNITNATNRTYTTLALTLADNGAQFRCIATNAISSATSSSATLTVIDGHRPTASISLPVTGTRFRAGEPVIYAGTAADAEDGSLPASAFTWEIVFHHDTHTHPFMLPTSGMTGGEFTPTVTSHGTTHIWYRIRLTVTASDGLTSTVYRDVQPETATITLRTSTTGVTVALDGLPRAVPLTLDEVVGVNWLLEATAPQIVSGKRWEFESWSDGGAASHTVVIPASDTTYTARFFACPLNLSQAPNGAPVPNFYTTATPTLAWGRISWATGYEVQVDATTQFIRPESRHVVDADTLSVKTVPLVDCLYYWRVRAKQPSGAWGAWSQPGAFVVDAP